MSRQVRIEFPGAFYHITSRGNQKQDIFLSDDDRYFFLNCLSGAYVKFGSLIHAYCLMDNHYHLFMETPGGNLSRVLHLINTTYAVYFNKRRERCGHPFQGRFKAILVQADRYARELVPYIHLNPVRAGITDHPEKFPWSNYLEYLGLMDSRPWTRTSLVLSCFGSQKDEARRRYAEYVLRRRSQEEVHPLDPAKSTGILGQPDFVECMRKSFRAADSSSSEREIPQLRKPKVKPDLGKITASAEVVLGAKNRLTKRIAIFVSHKNTDYTLRELGDYYHMSISAISEACRSTKKALPFNQSIVQAVIDVENRAFG
jgi:putative transposase